MQALTVRRQGGGRGYSVFQLCDDSGWGPAASGALSCGWKNGLGYPDSSCPAQAVCVRHGTWGSNTIALAQPAPFCAGG